MRVNQIKGRYGIHQIGNTTQERYKEKFQDESKRRMPG